MRNGRSDNKNYFNMITIESLRKNDPDLEYLDDGDIVVGRVRRQIVECKGCEAPIYEGQVKCGFCGKQA